MITATDDIDDNTTIATPTTKTNSANIIKDNDNTNSASVNSNANSASVNSNTNSASVNSNTNSASVNSNTNTNTNTNSANVNSNTNDSVNSNTNTNSSSLNKLNNDQLREYVKKLLAKLKRLEQQQQQAAGSKSDGGSQMKGVHDTVYWELIARATPFQQKIAAASLLPLLRLVGSSPSSLKNIFKRWKQTTDIIKTKTLEKQVEEATKRYIKVKALLQRQHQANQQNVEEKNMMKISQREALQELKSMKQREDHEREELLETLRIQTIEAAFHNDLEILIQQKADELYSQQQMLREKEKDLLEKKQILMTSTNDKMQREDNIESDNTSALNEARNTEKEERVSGHCLSCSQRILSNFATTHSLDPLSVVASLESKLEAADQENASLKNSKQSIENSLSNAQIIIKEGVEERKTLRRRLEEEEMLREELEVELKMTLSNQSTILEDMNKYTEVLVSKRCEELTLENKNIRKQLEAALHELDAIRNNNQTVSVDVNAMRMANDELLRQCREVPRLEALIAELKNSQVLMQRSKQHETDLSKSFMDVIETGLAISNSCETYMAMSLSNRELVHKQSQRTKMLASGVVRTLLSLGEGSQSAFASKLLNIERHISSLQSELEESREDDDIIIKTHKFSSLLKQQARLKILVDRFNDLNTQLQQTGIVDYLKADCDVPPHEGQGEGQGPELKQQILRFQEVSSKFKSKLFHDLPSSKLTEVGTSSTVSSQSHGLKMNTTGTVAMYSGESILIKPGDEFRIRIPPVADRPFMLSYQFCLPKDKQKSADIGFAIVTEKSDGSLPQISRYRRVRAQGESKQMIINPDHSSNQPSETIALVFDNTYSWTRSKEIRYEVKIESIAEAVDDHRQEQPDNTHDNHTEDIILRNIINSVEESIGACIDAVIDDK